MLTLTNDVLDRLGFTEYDDLNGDSGIRRLRFKSGAVFSLVNTDETEDVNYGMGKDRIYRGEAFFALELISPVEGMRPIRLNAELITLEDVFSIVASCMGNSELQEFEEVCDRAFMSSYLEDYKRHKMSPVELKQNMPSSSFGSVQVKNHSTSNTVSVHFQRTYQETQGGPVLPIVEELWMEFSELEDFATAIERMKK